MPELPEVETIKNGLKNLVVGKSIKSVDILNPKSFQADPYTINTFVIHKNIIDVKRRAKMLIIDLSSKYSILTHLKMTGQIVFVSKSKRFGAGHPNNSLIEKLPDRSTRVIFDLSKKSKLYFNDQRKFGWMKVVPTATLTNDQYFKKHGPEPLEEDFTLSIFKNNLRKHLRSNIKATLLDQSVLSGIGNIYADESLFLAKIHPKKTVQELSDKDIKELHKNIKYILNLSIAKGGSTDRNYVNAEGKNGSYLEFASVFRRENQPCPVCGTEIKKIRVAGRGTHFCPKCQKILIK